MGDALDRSVLRRAMRRYAEALGRHREEIDSMNVYPVPDGDTGTNMLLTQNAVVAALADVGGDDAGPDSVEAVIARASLMGARGNSGVILSQVLRGLVEAMPQRGRYGPDELADGLQRAARDAYRAVARPVEGTILSVLRDAAEAATAAGRRSGADCRGVLAAALDEARAALARTPDQLLELKRAGVVDAGGKGIVLLIDAMLAAVSGEELSEPVGPLGPVGTTQQDGVHAPLALAYEVQFLLRAPDGEIGALRRRLGEIGDALVIVGGSGLFNVHVHTNDLDASLDIGRAAGTVDAVRVSSLAAMVADCMAGQARAVQASEATCGMVAVAEGAGLMSAFRSLGAVVVAGGPGNNPSVADLLEAVEGGPPGGILLLANHPKAVPAAERAAEAASKRTVVIPTRSFVAGLSVATAFNPMRSLEENASDMREGLARARGGELARAGRDAETPVGPVRKGQWVGMAEDEAVALSSSAAEAATALVRALADPDHEVVTLLLGAEAESRDRASVEEALRSSFPGMQVEVIEGGQPRYPFLIGVE